MRSPSDDRLIFSFSFLKTLSALLGTLVGSADSRSRSGAACCWAGAEGCEVGALTVGDRVSTVLRTYKSQRLTWKKNRYQFLNLCVYCIKSIKVSHILLTVLNLLCCCSTNLDLRRKSFSRSGGGIFSIDRFTCGVCELLKLFVDLRTM